MEKFDFQYNFDNLDLVKLHRVDKITSDEIISVFENQKRSGVREVREEDSPSLNTTVFIKIAFSKKQRILVVAFMSPNDSIDFVGVKIANEDDMDFYCNG